MTNENIQIGDYIKSDFASWIQGTIIGEGILGKNIPCWKIEMPNGKIEYIIKGQEVLLISRELNNCPQWADRS